MPVFADKELDQRLTHAEAADNWDKSDRSDLPDAHIINARLSGIAGYKEGADSQSGTGHEQGDVLLDRASEVEQLLTSLVSLVKPFIKKADQHAASKMSGVPLVQQAGSRPRTALVDERTPDELINLLALSLPKHGVGTEALMTLVAKILEYSVNTWDQGFMDKLYSSTNAVGVMSEALLAVLNTNVHVYHVSPVLTLIEKHTTRALAALFGLTGPHAGGISQPGGSASNQASLVIARNTLFPETKTKGLGPHRYVLFTSAHGHYSLEKAAQMAGFGSEAVYSVPVDKDGRMRPDELRRMVKAARDAKEIPFYVNATAGTTVLGSYDPFDDIATVCRDETLWLHIDGSWGGPVIFSANLAKDRLRGCERADSIAVTPHKMLGVPLTCSFLLAKDLRQFHKANTLPAGYLFHETHPDADVYDLADLTLQCGRRGDALKMFLGWVYYGQAGYASALEHAFEVAEYLFTLLESSGDFYMVSKSPLPCLQVCFYYAKDRALKTDADFNSQLTAKAAARLVAQGWMIDFAPGNKGKFFRVVVNRETKRSTIEGLVNALQDICPQVKSSLCQS